MRAGWNVLAATVSLVSLVTFALVGALLWFALAGPNTCNMTYMRKAYQRVPVQSGLSAKYKLLLYREGRIHNTQRLPLSFKGVPVLFIPGNAGSFDQTRSLASVSARMYRSMKQEQKVNEFHFFTMHFDEEFSALVGQTLWDQASFTNDCIRTILGLYNGSYTRLPDNPSPKSVVVIGHSMGGLVARALSTRPGYIPGSVANIITLNTPHREPPLNMDRSVNEFYRTTNAAWADASVLTQNTTVVSIAGGFRDKLVSSGLADLSGIVPNTRGFSILTEAMPTVRAQNDHQCITWCNQLMVTIIDNLYRCIDRNTRQMHAEPSFCFEKLRNGFISSTRHNFPFVPSNVEEKIPLRPPDCNGHLQYHSLHPDTALSFPMGKGKNCAFVLMTDLEDHLWDVYVVPHRGAKEESKQHEKNKLLHSRRISIPAYGSQIVYETKEKLHKEKSDGSFLSPTSVVYLGPEELADVDKIIVEWKGGKSPRQGRLFGGFASVPLPRVVDTRTLPLWGEKTIEEKPGAISHIRLMVQDYRWPVSVSFKQEHKPKASPGNTRTSFVYCVSGSFTPAFL